jgi:preprotein translocase subunit SecG
MQTILIVVHLLLALGLIGLVLLQHGKGADAGAAFGSGASATVFGSRGAGSFLSRTTAILAALFFITSLALAWFAMNSARDAGLMEQQVQEQPAAPAAAPAPSDLPDLGEKQAAPAPSSDVPVVPAEQK